MVCGVFRQNDFLGFKATQAQLVVTLAHTACYGNQIAVLPERFGFLELLVPDEDFEHAIHEDERGDSEGLLILRVAVRNIRDHARHLHAPPYHICVQVAEHQYIVGFAVEREKIQHRVVRCGYAKQFLFPLAFFGVGSVQIGDVNARQLGRH